MSIEKRFLTDLKSEISIKKEAYNENGSNTQN
jgi:hypothetical protein